MILFIRERNWSCKLAVVLQQVDLEQVHFEVSFK